MTTRSTRGLYMMSMVGVVVLAGYLVFALFTLGPPKPVIPDDPQQIALGRAVYADNCASCHGADLKGEPNWQTPKADGTLPAPPHDDSGHTWHHDDALLLDYIRRGGAALFGDKGVKSNMPGFAEVLSEEEIQAVLAFIKSHWSPENLARQLKLNPG